MNNANEPKLAIQSFEKELAELDTEKRGLEQKRTQLNATLKLEESRLTARRRVLNDFATRIAETRQTINQTETALSEQANQESRLESEVVSLNNRLEFATHNLNRVLGDTEVVQGKLESVEAAQAEAQKREQQLKVTLVQLDTEKRQIEEERQKRRDLLPEA